MPLSRQKAPPELNAPPRLANHLTTVRSCETAELATPFAALPIIDVGPGPSKGTTAFCFNLTLVSPTNPGSKCGRSSGLLKAEFYADDKQRRKVNSIGVQPAGGAMRYLSATWGAVGENTLKATPLNWSKAQANGGRICLVLYDTVTLDSFCMGNELDTCW